MLKEQGPTRADPCSVRRRKAVRTTSQSLILKGGFPALLVFTSQHAIFLNMDSVEASVEIEGHDNFGNDLWVMTVCIMKHRCRGLPSGLG